MMITRREKLVRIEVTELPEGNITDVDNYKRLGIPQPNGNHEEAPKKAATAKYLEGLRSQQNGRNKIRAIRYRSGIINWSKEETEVTSVKTRKLLKM